MRITYQINAPVSAAQFIDLLEKSTLGERRPVHDTECIAGMIANSNLTVTAWESDELVGIARSITDFHYACYVSDLAVCQSSQQRGIGGTLLAITQEQLGPRCTLILIAAPAANTYYEHIGFTNNQRCWTLEREDRVGG